MYENEKYSDYLKTRTIFGWAYRKFWLYPSISRLLKGRLLDVGCGIGDMLAYRPGSVGADVNKSNVNFCKSLGFEVYDMPYDNLPFPDSTFDSVLLDNVIEHISNPIPLLTQIKRVMRKDGFLVIGVPGICGQISDLDHKIYYDEDKLRALAFENGFVIKSFKYTPLIKSSFLSKTLKQYCIYSQWCINV